MTSAGKPVKSAPGPATGDDQSTHQCAEMEVFLALYRLRPYDWAGELPCTVSKVSHLQKLRRLSSLSTTNSRSSNSAKLFWKRQDSPYSRPTAVPKLSRSARSIKNRSIYCSQTWSYLHQVFNLPRHPINFRTSTVMNWQFAQP